MASNIQMFLCLFKQLFYKKKKKKKKTLTRNKKLDFFFKTLDLINNNKDIQNQKGDFVIDMISQNVTKG